MRRKTLWILMTVVLALTGCQLPFFATPTPFVFPTPDLTLTAVFAPQPITPLPTPTSPEIITATSPPETSPTPSPSPTSESPTVTHTPLFPTETATPPRTTRAIEAGFLRTAPNLDGVWDEWTTSAFPARSVTFGRGNWGGADDLELSYRVGWDEQYLYLAVKVRDDVYAQNASGDQIFKGDSLEILLDVDLQGDYVSRQLSGDDYQLGISPGRPDAGMNLEAYLWYPTGKAGTKDQVRIAAVGSPGVYRMEAAVPWSLFGITPSAGQRYGFAISVSDNDNLGQNVQQSMVSSADRRDLLDPTTWGELTLTR